MKWQERPNPHLAFTEMNISPQTTTLSFPSTAALAPHAPRARWVLVEISVLQFPSSFLRKSGFSDFCLYLSPSKQSLVLLGRG